MSLRVYADRLVVAAEGQLLCEHTRIIDRRHDTAGQTVYDWRHYLVVLQRKPGALRNGAPFSELPQGFRRLKAVLLKQPGGDREMVEKVERIRQVRYDTREQARLDIVDWIEGFYNRMRLHTAIGYLASVDKERSLLAA